MFAIQKVFAMLHMLAKVTKLLNPPSFSLPLFFSLRCSILSRSLSLSPAADHRTVRPPLVPGFPENTTAVMGGNVKLVCKVHKPASTRIQWLKKDDTLLGDDNQPHLRALTVQEHLSTELHLLTEAFYFSVFVCVWRGESLHSNKIVSLFCMSFFFHSLFKEIYPK